MRPTKNADLIWQEIKGLPAGSYRVTAVAMGRAQGNDNVCAEGLYLFANSGQEAVSTNVWGEVSVVGTVCVLVKTMVTIGWLFPVSR